MLLSGLMLAGVAFTTALACSTLRDFSRSRLKEICDALHKEKRFGDILRRHEQAQVLLDAVFICSIVGAAVILGLEFGLCTVSTPANQSQWFLLALQWTLLFIVAAVCCGALPWTLARVLGEHYLARIWPVIRPLLTIGVPYLALSRSMDLFGHRLFGLPDPAENNAASLTEEIRTVVDEGQREGIIEQGASSMIQRVMTLHEDDVAAIMTPRTAMVTISADCSLSDARQQLLDAGHSRIPVIGESTDDIVGILYAKDLLRAMHTSVGPTANLRDVLRDVFFVPESKGIDDLLETMKHRHVQLAIVVDEYSGVAGLVTMEDILEEIVGEINDEYDEDEEEWVRTCDDGRIEVDARIHIDELNERFGFKIPEHDDYDTIAGFVLAQFGRIPSSGESFTIENLRIHILAADGRRVREISIEINPALTAASMDDS